MKSKSKVSWKNIGLIIRLGGLSITHDAQGNSLLTGVVPDQAALHGILAQIRGLGLTLISLTPQDVEEKEDTDEKPNGNTARRPE